MKFSKLLLAMAASGIATSAFATNGYFSHGYGMTAKGMAGAATAMTKDAFGGANNPATMVWVGNRYDVGADAFSPVRNATRSGSDQTFYNAPFLSGVNGSFDSDNELFGVPEFGYNKMINDRMSLGVSVYGNGGMNTDYGLVAHSGAGGASYNLLNGTTALGVDLTQLIIAPTVSYKTSDQTSVGISALLGYQQFEAYGLQAFSDMSSSRANLTNNGKDSATGLGARVGVYHKVNDSLSVGAAYATKVDMSKFDKYQGLFAEQGDFDLPANWNVGLTFRPNDKVSVALDYQHIAYSDVKAVANPSTNILTGSLGKLGADGGAGFGWSDMDILKLGIEYVVNPRLTVRAGYSHADSPIAARDVTFNILAPAVIEDHYTFGMTYALDKSSDLTVSYAHAVENSLSGNSLFTTLSGAYLANSGTETIKMHQNSIGIAYSKKF